MRLVILNKKIDSTQSCNTADKDVEVTVHSGYNYIGYDDISITTMLIFCPELFSSYYHTKSFVCNVLNNDISPISTHMSS